MVAIVAIDNHFIHRGGHHKKPPSFSPIRSLTTGHLVFCVCVCKMATSLKPKPDINNNNNHHNPSTPLIPAHQQESFRKQLILLLLLSILLCVPLYFFAFQTRNLLPTSTEVFQTHKLIESAIEEDWPMSSRGGGVNFTGLDQSEHVVANAHRRVKRGVFSLASMIKCYTGCNPLSYKDYGCYCGFQGDGFAVDGIDRCCYMHDRCYEQSECHQALVYFVSYKWACHHNRAKCGYAFGGSAKSMCAFQLCECDRKFAKCLSRYPCPHSKPGCIKHVVYGK